MQSKCRAEGTLRWSIFRSTTIFLRPVPWIRSFSSGGSSLIGRKVLHALERNAKEHWVDHHPDSEDEVLRVVDRRSQYVSLGERPDVWWTLRTRHPISEKETSKSYDPRQEGKRSAWKSICWRPGRSGLIDYLFTSDWWELHDRYFISQHKNKNWLSVRAIAANSLNIFCSEEVIVLHVSCRLVKIVLWGRE